MEKKILNTSDVCWRQVFDSCFGSLFEVPSPGRLSWSNNGPLMSFAVRVRVEEHVAIQTQALNTRGALSVYRCKPTDAAVLYTHIQKQS